MNDSKNSPHDEKKIEPSPIKIGVLQISRTANLPGTVSMAMGAKIPFDELEP
jgi:hypothetical protein